MSDAHAVRVVAPSVVPTPSRRNTVLLLEDNETLAGLVTVILTQIGLKVVWTRFGHEGLAKFSQVVDDVVLVLSDCHLPDMHGGDVCRHDKTRGT